MMRSAAVRPHIRSFTGRWRRYSSVSGTALPQDSEVEAARQYCLKTLMQYDMPSYIARSYIPARARDAFIAIRAFNVDVARTADTVSSPTIGAMRLQFQRDAVAKTLAGSPPKQPVFILLSNAVQQLQQITNGQMNFSKSWFNRVISTREEFLANPPYPNLQAVERYSENTYSTLMYLTLQALPMASLTADHLASHIGKATGIATVLRGLPLIAFPDAPRSQSNQEVFGGAMESQRQGAVLLPLDIMAEYNVREEDVMRKGSDASGLRDAVFAVATRANDHLITAREMLKNVMADRDAGHDFEHEHEEEHALARSSDPEVKPSQEVRRAFGVFMPAAATSLWLKQLEKADFDIFNPDLRKTDWRLPFKTWWAYTRKQF